MNKYRNDINSAEYVFVHFINAKFENVACETDKILKKKREKFTTICTRLGKVKKVQVLK